MIEHIETREKTDLKNLSPDQLISFVESLSQPAFRGRQIFSWLYKPGIINFSQMTDLAKEFRKILKKHAGISIFENPIIEKSRDGSIKFGFFLEERTQSGEKRGDEINIIEAVLIPDAGRNTLCISSQVGCKMGCHFCLTGSMGFRRNLNTAEIINQVCAVRDWILEHDMGKISNIVFMGMGEPLANLKHVLPAISILTNQRGLDISARRITVSTCGLVNHMQELGEKTDVNLAISLHAVDDQTRTSLMPINKKYPLDELLAAAESFPMKKRQRIMFEYTLLQGINDSDEDAENLARILKGIPCKINLLAFNETKELMYKNPGLHRLLEFQKILRRNRFSTFIRQSRGGDISAACGQLAGKRRVKGKNNEVCVS